MNRASLLRIAAIIVMSVSTFTMCTAQDLANAIPDIKAVFTPKSASQSLVGDKVAQDDDIQCLISSPEDLSFSNADVEVGEGTTFTFTSNTFKNIMGVRLYFEEITSTDPNQIVQIVSADGTGFTEISDLNNVSVINKSSVRFYFSEPLVLLSEVKLEMQQDAVLLKIEVSLDVEPEFLIKDGDTIYSDDSVPFVKRSNYMSYKYCIDAPHPIDIADFNDVPKDGIKLTGQSKGQHTIYLDVDSDKTVENKYSLKTVTVNYDPVKPNDGNTTSIDSIISEEDGIYYDLTGRRISPKSGQLLIRKTGSSSKLIRL